MDYLSFRNQMYDLACFSIDQVYAWQPGFDRNNLYRWTKKGLLVRLKRGYFAFPEYKRKPDYAWYFANCMYKPSYISLHTALSFYGIIPESVIQITSVTTLKTISFFNEFAQYTYRSVKKELMFGYGLKSLPDGRGIRFASSEKALLDLLYLYPEYNTLRQMEDLRLDGDFIHNEFNIKLFKDYLKLFHNKALEHRVKLFFSAYGLSPLQRS